MSAADEAQLEMVHRLPRARLVQRIPYVAGLVRGRSVIHVGFVDAGYQEMQAEAGTWLHAHLGDTAKSLIGIDLDETGVAQAKAEGYEAYVADCRDPQQIDALGIQPAEVVVAGEVIEHLDDPGSFLDGLHRLLAPGGELILTTPNASGLLNGFAAMAGAEINHPDHVILFSWRTLTNLMSRHGWEVVDTATFVPAVKAAPGSGLRQTVLGLAGRFVLWLERTIGKLWAPFVADGLILTARSTR
ncbi:MAG TPA: class I SAM-dependent methyltransferase [Acidimicrobiales bacterium]|nr:class I SAM-dependent methyltransferase [Acidimicrobiales bacterium]